MDELKELLGEELFAQLTAKLGDKKAAIVSTGQWIPKAKFDEVNAAKKKTESDLVERDKQLETLSKSAGDNKALQDQITQLQADNKTAKEQYEAEAKQLRINTAIKLSLAGKVHDPDLVAGLIDGTKVELDDTGAVKGGLDDQVKALQTNKGFLFKQEDKGGFKGFTPFQKQSPEDDKDNGALNFGKMAAAVAKANAPATDAHDFFK